MSASPEADYSSDVAETAGRKDSIEDFSLIYGVNDYKKVMGFIDRLPQLAADLSVDEFHDYQERLSEAKTEGLKK
ncbi:MAG: hypothetical protein MMC33_003863 [Icmadophila ericetorum]|nr:hypothetical protein [Icmadophila ericetorum]